MALLAATPSSLHRVPDPDSQDATSRPAPVVLDRGVRTVRASSDAAYAATGDGLFVSEDGGETWTRTALDADVHSVTADGRLAGTRPLGVYRRVDGDWHRLGGLDDLADHAGWPTPSFRDEAWARSLASDGDRVLVGVEVGGLAVRDLDGTWRSTGPTEPDPDGHQRRDDVHHVAVRRADEWLLATGAGVFRTTNAGADWTRLDTGERRYAREVGLADGHAWVGVNDSPPRWRPPDAAVYLSLRGDARTGDGQQDGLQRLEYPGEPTRFLLSWADGDGARYAGANDGTILRFGDGGVTVTARVPVEEEAATAYGVLSLAVV